MSENAFEKIQSLRFELECVEREIEKCQRSLLRLERQRKKDRVQLVKCFFITCLSLGLCRYFLLNNFIYAMSFGGIFLYFFFIRLPYLILSYMADSGIKGVRRIFFKNSAYCYAKEKEKNIAEIVGLEARRGLIQEQIQQFSETALQ